MNIYASDNKYLITARVITDNALSNGAATNEVEFTFTDATTYDPASGIDVVVEVDPDSSATIKESNSVYYKALTNSQGKITANITDTQAESVTVTAFVLVSQSDNAELTVNFLPDGDSTFKITSVTNLNQTFTTGQPTIAWAGASFIIHTQGGSGPITWTVSGATQEVVVEGDESERTAGVTILSKPQLTTLITAKDTNTGETDQLVIDIDIFVEPITDKTALGVIIANYGDALLSVDTYTTLYKEWGNMGAYAAQGWKVDDTYWTSTDYNYLTQTGRDFHLDTGVEGIDLITIFNTHYYCIELGK